MIDNRRTRISLQKSNQAIIKRVYAINKSLINSHQSLDIAEAFLSLRFCYITQVFCHKQPSVSKLTNRITKYVIIRQNLDVNLLLLCLVKAIKLDPLSDSWFCEWVCTILVWIFEIEDRISVPGKLCVVPCFVYSTEKVFQMYFSLNSEIFI